MEGLELFLTGLLLCAMAEMEDFTAWCRMHDVTRELDLDWQLEATRRGWHFQSYFWGDPNS